MIADLSGYFLLPRLANMLTVSNVLSILEKLSQVDFGSLQTAFQARGADLQADEAAAEALIQAIGDVGLVIPGGPILTLEIAVATEVVSLVLTKGTQDRYYGANATRNESSPPLNFGDGKRTRTRRPNPQAG